MKSIISFAFVLMSMAIYGQTTFNYIKDFKTILARTKDNSDSLFYYKLLSRFRLNDTSLTDFQVLAALIGHTAMPEYKPYQDLEKEREIYKLNGESKFKKALEQANKFLNTHPLNIKSLYEKAYSFHKLDKKDSAQYYIYQGRRIFEAMHFSGDGKSRETPTFALGPADGQDFVRKFVGAKIGTMGSGRDGSGNFIDILEAIFEDGSTLKFYFIIQHASEKMFEGLDFDKPLKEKQNN